MGHVAVFSYMLRPILLLLLLVVTTTVAYNNQYTEGNSLFDVDDDNHPWVTDYVLWWSYARVPIATFVFGTSLLTWFMIYRNRHLFVEHSSPGIPNIEKKPLHVKKRERVKVRAGLTYMSSN